MVSFLIPKIVSKDSMLRIFPLKFFKSIPTEKLLTSKAKTLLFLSSIFPLFANREYSECDRLITCLSKKLS